MTTKKLIFIIIGCLLLGFLLLVILVYRYEYKNFDHFQITGIAMTPNYKDGEVYRADENSYKSTSVQRGDVVAYKDVKDPSKIQAKRIIGLPGEEIMVMQDKVYINGKLLEESYLQSGTTTNPGDFMSESKKVTIPQDNFIVLGDNRDHSSDSRIWGLLHKENIVAKLLECFQKCTSTN